MVLAMKRLRLSRAEGFAEGLAQGPWRAKGPEHLAPGLERARMQAISQGDFDRADALQDIKQRLCPPSNYAAKVHNLQASLDQAFEKGRQEGRAEARAELEPVIAQLQERIRQLENGNAGPDTTTNETA